MTHNGSLSPFFQNDKGIKNLTSFLKSLRYSSNGNVAFDPLGRSERASLFWFVQPTI